MLLLRVYGTQYWYSGLNIIFLILLIIHNLIYNFKEAEDDLFQMIGDSFGIDLSPIKPIIDKYSARFSDEYRDECFTEKGKGKQGKLLLFLMYFYLHREVSLL